MMVEAFAGYGFVRGHACAFAYLAYVSCWLKVYHPAAFCTVLLNAQPMGFYPPEVVLQDAARHGVRTRPVDIRHSRAGCTVEAGAVRLGLGQIRGLGAATCARIEAAMGGDTPPESLDDLCMRARLEQDEAVALARAGALRNFLPERREALWRAPAVARAAQERWLPEILVAVDPPVALPSATAAEEQALDRRALGFSPRQHALSSLRAKLTRRSIRGTADLRAWPRGATIDIAGQVVSRQRPGTAKGVMFLTLSDEDGLTTIVVPPTVYERDRAAVRSAALVWVRGVVERRDGVVSVRAERVRLLADALTSSDEQ